MNITENLREYAAEQQSQRAMNATARVAPPVQDDGDPYFIPPREAMFRLMVHQAVILNVDTGADQ